MERIKEKPEIFVYNFGAYRDDMEGKCSSWTVLRRREGNFKSFNINNAFQNARNTEAIVKKALLQRDAHSLTLWD